MSPSTLGSAWIGEATASDYRQTVTSSAGEGSWRHGGWKSLARCRIKEEALAELESVLRDWAAIKLAEGDDDIPPMKGIHLVLPL